MIAYHQNDKKIGWENLFIAGLLILTFLPFLGETLYSTKGEPREAIVALSMLNSGNWVLPITFGAEIPYKPPMLAWCIALLGWLNGGEITEYLSRLPSALATIMMIVVGFRMFARRVSVNMAVAMSLITAGFFELFRAGTICRVDMLLTMFVVTALYAFYRQCQRNPEGTWKPSLVAALLMSGGVLTKGPVGMLLPCMVVFVFRLMRGNKVGQTMVSVGVSALLSLILPALWYIAAYRQGGEVFLRLVLEENFGRFTGSMTYESHENPAWYNLLTLTYGCTPYTLLLLMSLFCIPWIRNKENNKYNESCLGVKARLGKWWQNLRNSDPIELFSLLALVLIFVFYCIPKSKRSVYLLPVYPFVAYFIAKYARFLLRRLPSLVKAYCWVIVTVGCVAAVVFFAGAFGFFSAIKSSSIAPVVASLQNECFSFWPVTFGACTLIAGVCLMRVLCRNSAKVGFGWTMVYTLLIYWMVSCAILPSATNYRSDKVIANEIESMVPADAKIYAYRPDPMGALRYYMIGFYLGDRMHLFDVDFPTNGYLVIGEDDFKEFSTTKGANLQFNQVYISEKKSRESRQLIMLLRFQNK